MTEMLRPDIQHARDRMNVRFGSNREIRKLESYLWHGEQVHAMVGGFYSGGYGLLVVADRRLLFVRDGWVSEASESFGFDQVNSVQWSTGMVLGKIIIYSAGNKATVEQVDKQDGRSIVDRVNHILTGPGAQQAPPPAQAPAPAVPPQPPPMNGSHHTGPVQQNPVMSPFDMLKSLRDHGIISSVEFTQLVNRL